jgi:hypothetical protein
MASVASGMDVGPASVAFGVAVACALSVPCAATVMATAVEIVFDSASAPPQDVKTRAKNMRMDRKLCFRFLFILCPFGIISDLPAEYYTFWTLKNTHEKRPATYRALTGH